MSFYVGTPAKSPPAAAASAASSFAALPSASGTSGWRRFVLDVLAMMAQLNPRNH